MQKKKNKKQKQKQKQKFLIFQQTIKCEEGKVMFHPQLVLVSSLQACAKLLLELIFF
jgi:hypothetical protein